MLIEGTSWERILMHYVRRNEIPSQQEEGLLEMRIPYCLNNLVLQYTRQMQAKFNDDIL